MIINQLICFFESPLLLFLLLFLWIFIRAASLIQHFHSRLTNPHLPQTNIFLKKLQNYFKKGSESWINNNKNKSTVEFGLIALLWLSCVWLASQDFRIWGKRIGVRMCGCVRRSPTQPQWHRRWLESERGRTGRGGRIQEGPRGWWGAPLGTWGWGRSLWCVSSPVTNSTTLLKHCHKTPAMSEMHFKALVAEFDLSVNLFSSQSLLWAQKYLQYVLHLFFFRITTAISKWGNVWCEMMHSRLKMG